MSNASFGTGSYIDPRAEIGVLPGKLISIVPTRIGNGAFVRSFTVIYTNTIIGAGLETGHNVVIKEGSVIEDRLWIWDHSIIDADCQIGSRVRIHSHVYVAQKTVIEDDVFLAPGVKMADDRHPVSERIQGPVIKQGAIIGVNATLLPGIIVGKGAFVGAGSVVTKDVPDGVLVYGNPARIQRKK